MEIVRIRVAQRPHVEEKLVAIGCKEERPKRKCGNCPQRRSHIEKIAKGRGEHKRAVMMNVISREPIRLGRLRRDGL